MEYERLVERLATSYSEKKSLFRTGELISRGLLVDFPFDISTDRQVLSWHDMVMADGADQIICQDGFT